MNYQKQLADLIADYKSFKQRIHVPQQNCILNMSPLRESFKHGKDVVKFMKDIHVFLDRVMYYIVKLNNLNLTEKQKKSIKFPLDVKMLTNLQTNFYTSINTNTYIKLTEIINRCTPSDPSIRILSQLRYIDKDIHREYGEVEKKERMIELEPANQISTNTTVKLHLCVVDTTYNGDEIIPFILNLHKVCRDVIDVAIALTWSAKRTISNGMGPTANIADGTSTWGAKRTISDSTSA